jgi:hypothetical protein
VPATEFNVAGGASSAGPFVLTRKHRQRGVRSTRPTVRPDRRNGATTIVFRLSRPAVVRFTVVRVSPTCERIGAFRVRAHAGVNRVPFRGRLQGRALSQGTYRLLVRALGAGADAAALNVVVVRGKPLSVEELRQARRANVCGVTTTVDGEAAETALGTPSPPSDAPRSDAKSGSADGSIAAGAGTIGRGAKILGTRFTKAIENPSSVHPLVWAALALSIFLLALAAVPPAAFASARAEALAYHRFEVALAGTAALGAAFLMYLIS